MSTNRRNRDVVIAGAHDQFKDWCKKNGAQPKWFIYASSREAVMGARAHTLWLVGSWEDQPPELFYEAQLSTEHKRHGNYFSAADAERLSAE